MKRKEKRTVFFKIFFSKPRLSNSSLFMPIFHTPFLLFGISVAL